MATMIDLLRDVDKADNLQRRRQVREAWTVGRQRNLGQAAKRDSLVDDDGQGGWTITPLGAEYLGTAGTLQGAAARAGEAEDELVRHIVAARKHGLSLREIATATGRTHQTIANIVERELGHKWVR